MISEVQLYPKETWTDGSNPIKTIKYTFLASNEAMETLGENEASVETHSHFLRGEKCRQI